ncbi:MAG: PTS transporter subunit EIIC [Firmicutes bacterium]|jgi:PTS system beta-glucosides-specific IIC component|nr:PTS transporter subunit EIIC [Bacillota bacterium]
MDYENIAKQILQHIGGKENVATVIHCMTRLRFTLKNEAIANDEAVKNTKGVVGVMKKAGQYQIIIGNDVGNVYDELCKLGDFSNSIPIPKKQEVLKNKNNITQLMEIISSIMAPVIPAIMGTAMIRILTNLLHMLDILDVNGTTYYILNIIGDSAFFFFPVLIAISAAKRFCVNVYYAVTVALILMHPNFMDMMDKGENLYFMKYIPLPSISYAYSIIPIIFAIWILKYVERLAEKIIPTILKNLLQSLFVLLVEVLIVLFVLAPFGSLLEHILYDIIDLIHNQLGFIAVGMIAGIYPFIVMAGIHHALTPVKLGMIASAGFENFICIGELCSNIAQGAASAAVAVKSKNKILKKNATTAAISALFTGITEPALYGVTLRLKRPIIGACIGAAIGGLFGAFFQLKCFAIAIPAILSIVQYVDTTYPISFLIAILTILVTIVATFFITLLIGFKDISENDIEEKTKIENHSNQTLFVPAPAKGKMIPLTEVKDVTFASEILGKGAVIIPEENKIVAPFSGKVAVVFETGHAIALQSDEGLELLIHVGIDTVNLKGKFFHPCVENGTIIKKGDVLLNFDREEIEKEGYDLSTPIIITNTENYKEITLLNQSEHCELLQDFLSVK